LKAFVADIAVKTGKGRSTVARDVTRAKKVAVLDDIAGTSLDKGDEIDALGKLPEGEQRKLATAARAGEKVSAKARKPRQKGADTAVRTTTAEVDVDPKDAALREFDGHVLVREANDRGFRCVVLSDCCASYFPQFHEAGLAMIKAQGGIFGAVAASQPVLNSMAALS
jgi:hypothetical protein